MPANPFQDGISVGIQGDSSGLDDALDSASAGLVSFKKKVGLAGGALAALAGGAMAGAINEARKFQSAMVEVEKVTNPSTAQEMSASIKEMAETIPLAQQELADIAADAGRFGVEGTESIEKFTKATAKMATATDLNAKEAGESFARLAELTDTPIPKVENLGSSINALSNNFATSAQEIVDSMMRSAGAMSQFGLSQTEIAGFSAALNAVSESSERAGTRLRRLVQEIMNPKNAQDLARAMNLSVEEFKALQKNDPADMLRTMAQLMKADGAAADSLRKNLSTTSRQALAGMGQNIDGLNESLKMSKREFEENSSLQKEFDAATDTFNATLQTTLNRLRNVAITIGNVLLPYLTSMLEVVAGGISRFQDFNEATNGIPATIGLVATAVGGLASVLWAFGPSAATVKLALMGIAGSFTSLIGTIAGIPMMIVSLGATIAGLAATIWGALFGALMALPGAAASAAVSLGTTLYTALLSVGSALIGLPATIASFALSLGTTLATAAASAVSSLIALPGIIAAKTAAMITSASVTGLMSGALGLLSTAAGLASVSLGAVVATLGTLLLPLTLAAGAVAALYVAWQNNFLGLRDITNRVVKMVKALMAGDMKGAMNQAKLLVKDLKVVWQNQIIPIWNTTKRVFNQIKNTIMQVLNFVWNNLVKPIVNRIRTIWSQHSDELRSEAKETWTAIQGHIETIRSVVWPIISWFIDKAGSAWNKWGDEIKTYAKFIFDAVTGIVGTAFDAILTAVKVAMNLIQGDWEEAWDEIKGFLQRTFDGIISFAKKWGGRFLDWIGGLVDDAIQWFKDLAHDLIGGSVIPNMLSDIISAIKNWNFVSEIKSVADDALSKVEGFASDFKDAGEAILDTFIDGIENKTNAVGNAVDDAVQEARDKLPGSDAKEGPLSDLTDSGEALPETFAEGIENNLKSVRGASMMTAQAAAPTAQGGQQVVNINVDARGASNPRETRRQGRHGVKAALEAHNVPR